MSRFLFLTKAMFLIHIRNRITMFWNMVFPVFIMVIYALIFGNSTVGTLSYMTWVLPGVIVLNILAYGLMGSSSMLVNLREQGVLRRLQATPVPAFEIIGSYLIVNVAVAAIQVGLVLATAALFFGFDLTLLALLRSLPMILAAILVSVALGMIVSGLAPKAGVALAVGQILYFSQMFITDMIMPIERMPEWLQSAARFLPGYAITQLVRAPLVFGEWDPALLPNLLLLAGYAALAAVLAAVFFRWAPRS
jgi:ABC-2 type transport system permease protein